MTPKNIYTSTITVPVYASWKCEKCGEVNFSTGAISCKWQKSSGSWLPVKQREAKEMAASLAQAEWAEKTYQIISNPNKNAQKMRDGLFLQNTHCTKCGKKPKWDKDMKYLTLVSLCFMPAIMSCGVAISIRTSLVAWLIFAAFLAIIVAAVISESHYKKMMKKLPKKYTPVIGSLNVELKEYVNALGKTIPDPSECIATVKEYDEIEKTSMSKV